jgi:hypothetical protein
MSQNGLATRMATDDGSRCSGFTYEFGTQRSGSDFPVFDHYFQMHGTIPAEPVAFNPVGRGRSRGIHHRWNLQTEDSAFAHVAKWSAASGVETLGKHNRLLSSPGVGAYRRHPGGKGSSFTHSDRNKHARRRDHGRRINGRERWQSVAAHARSQSSGSSGAAIALPFPRVRSGCTAVP